MNKPVDTYFALSSPPGRSATATIRISGGGSLGALTSLTYKQKSKFIHGTTSLCNIFNKNKILIDKVVVVYYRGPKSYTGDDMVEIHTHGNPLITQSLFNELVDLGLRLAEPGEFTRNAYLNHKIDLVQAEGVFNLIAARTNSAVQLSIHNLEGRLSRSLRELRTSLIYTLSSLEYELDISESDNYKRTVSLVADSIKNTSIYIKKLINTYKTAKLLTDGARVVIVGGPNVGKSTLFNALLGQDRAIVTNTPGTTRDVIDGSLWMSGFSVLLVDTAGIRKTNNPIECEGIKKTNLEIERADIIYHMCDSTKKFSTKKLPTTTKTITIYNKTDLLSPQQRNRLKKKDSTAVLLSAKFSTGLHQLKLKTKQELESMSFQSGTTYITSKRQQVVLLGVLEILNRASAPGVGEELELIAVDLRLAIDQFDWLLGKISTDDILNTIFSDFCVGK